LILVVRPTSWTGRSELSRRISAAQTVDQIGLSTALWHGGADRRADQTTRSDWPGDGGRTDDGQHNARPTRTHNQWRRRQSRPSVERRRRTPEYANTASGQRTQSGCARPASTVLLIARAANDQSTDHRPPSTPDVIVHKRPMPPTESTAADGGKMRVASPAQRSALQQPHENGGCRPPHLPGM
jgi:hypothetical protein